MRLGVRSLLAERPAVRRAAYRLGLHPPLPSAVGLPPARPAGAKLELTYRCNLKCGFCYTDSPRRTREGAIDLSDDDWRRIADEVIEAGAIETVVTGGEPLLRRDLALELVDRFSEDGLSVTLNTNGWFVDEEVADRLAEHPGVTVRLSIDGANARAHDLARGVPGSWERAVRCADLMLRRGVRLQVIHVVTPANAGELRTFLEHMWLLGVSTVDVTTVVPIGAAARADRWRVSRRRVQSVLDDFAGRPDFECTLRLGTLAFLAFSDTFAPQSILVRPNGAVLTDSHHPFLYGNARREGIEACWERVRAHWRHPSVAAWAAAIRDGRKPPPLGPVPYLDDEVPPANVQLVRHPPVEELPPPLRPVRSGDPLASNEAARAHVRELALARSYRSGRLRSGGGLESLRYVRVVSTGQVVRLNATASAVLDACDGGTAADAVATLAQRHPSVERDRIVGDVLAAVRVLVAHGALEPAEAPSREPVAAR